MISIMQDADWICGIEVTMQAEIWRRLGGGVGKLCRQLTLQGDQVPMLQRNWTLPTRYLRQGNPTFLTGLSTCSQPLAPLPHRIRESQQNNKWPWLPTDPIRNVSGNGPSPFLCHPDGKSRDLETADDIRAQTLPAPACRDKGFMRDLETTNAFH